MLVSRNGFLGLRPDYRQWTDRKHVQFHLLLYFFFHNASRSTNRIFPRFRKLALKYALVVINYLGICYEYLKCCIPYGTICVQVYGIICAQVCWTNCAKYMDHLCPGIWDLMYPSVWDHMCAGIWDHLINARWLYGVFQSQYLQSWSMNYVAINKDL